MNFVSKKLMPAGDLVHRPPLHQGACTRTVFLGGGLTLAMLTLIVIWAFREGRAVSEAMIERSCSDDGFSAMSDCREVTHYPLETRMQPHDFLQADMLFYRSPKSKEEMKEELEGMTCSVQTVNSSYIMEVEYDGSFTLPDGLQFHCRHEERGHLGFLELTLLGYSVESYLRKFIDLFKLEASHLPPPPDPAWKFDVVGGSVAKFAAKTLGPIEAGTVAYAGLVLRFPNAEVLHYDVFQACDTDPPVFATQVLRDCVEGHPFVDRDDLDPNCSSDYSSNMSAWLRQSVDGILYSPAFFIDSQARNFTEMLNRTCSNWSKPLPELLRAWEDMIFSNSQRDMDELIMISVEDILLICPFQYVCMMNNLKIPLMLAVAFPLLSALAKVVAVGLPLTYAFFLKNLTRHRAKSLADGDLESIAGRINSTQDETYARINEELRSYVDEQVRKAVAAVRDELVAAKLSVFGSVDALQSEEKESELVLASAIERSWHQPSVSLTLKNELQAMRMQLQADKGSSSMVLLPAAPGKGDDPNSTDAGCSAHAHAGGVLPLLQEEAPSPLLDAADAAKDAVAAPEVTKSKYAASVCWQQELQELRHRLAATERRLASLQIVFLEAAASEASRNSSQFAAMTGSQRQSAEAKESVQYGARENEPNASASKQEPAPTDVGGAGPTAVSELVGNSCTKREATPIPRTPGPSDASPRRSMLSASSVSTVSAEQMQASMQGQSLASATTCSSQYAPVLP